MSKGKTLVELREEIDSGKLIQRIGWGSDYIRKDGSFFYKGEGNAELVANTVEDLLADDWVLYDEIASLKKTIKDLEAKHAFEISRVVGLKAENKMFENKIGILKADKDLLNDKLRDVQDEAKRNQEYLDVARKNFDELRDKFGHVSLDKDELSIEFGKLRDYNQTLEARVKFIEGHKAMAEAHRDKLKEKVAELEIKVASLTSESMNAKFNREEQARRDNGQD